MPLLNRNISTRLVAALLMLALLASPGFGSGKCTHHGPSDLAVPVAEKSACCHHDDAPAAPGEDPAQSSGGDCCSNCLHACCRTVAVVFRGLTLKLEGALVTPLVLPAESLHDPVTCDAIFHPPRR